MDYREEDLQRAIAALKAGEFTSKREAARVFGVPRQTLLDRINGKVTRREAQSYLQNLTPSEEEFLVEWIIDEDSLGRVPTHRRVREMAARVLKIHGEERVLGKGWITAFLQRNPRVKSVVGRKIASNRANAVTAESVNAFYSVVKQAQESFNITTPNMWNMDESGIGMGVCTNSIVIAPAEKKRAYKKTPENRTWTTIIECVSAAGKSIRATVIFKGQFLQNTYFPKGGVPDWLFTNSANGWTSNDIALEWLQNHFIPSTAPQEQSEYRLLLMDNHRSHITTEFMLACHQNQIRLVFMPPHSSHLLQPLDLTCFGSIKRRYRAEIEAVASLTDSAPIKHHEFIQCYDRARTEGLTERHIRAGWKAAGIAPWNPSIVLDSSLLLIRPRQPRESPATAAEAPDPPWRDIFTTPRKPQHLNEVATTLRRQQTSPTTMNIVLTKAGKAYGRAVGAIAELQLANQRLEKQLEDAQHHAKKRSRVYPDANKLFLDARSINEALEGGESAISNETLKRRKTTTTAPNLNSLGSKVQQPWQSMCNQFRIN